MRILVTGANGFIGRHLMNRLRSAGGFTHLVGTSRSSHWTPAFLEQLDHGSLPGESLEILLGCDIRQEAQVARMVSAVKPDVVYHLASSTSTAEWGVDISLTNVVGTHSLLRHCAHLNKPVRFVFASSATVYGDGAGKGFWVKETDDLLPNSAYGATKLAGEALVRAFSKPNGIHGCSVRLAATVGGGAAHGLLPDLVRKLKSPDRELNLLGHCPGASKPFTHVSDVVDGLMLFARNDFRGVVNLCSNDDLNVLTVSEIAEEVLGVQKERSWSGSSWAGDNRLVRIDSSLAKRWGWNPKVGDSEAAVRLAVSELAHEG